MKNRNKNFNLMISHALFKRNNHKSQNLVTSKLFTVRNQDARSLIPQNKLLNTTLREFTKAWTPWSATSMDVHSNSPTPLSLHNTLTYIEQKNPSSASSAIRPS